VTDPVPAVVPVKVTKQLPDGSNVHVTELREPPVVPAVNVKVTVPVGMLEAVVVSLTVAVTDAVQLVPPSAILQLASGTVVVVESLDVTVTVMVAAELVLTL